MNNGKSTHEKASPQTREEAVKAAKATQRPGQTKEQTKLIAQGIEKGISFYKKQQKAKSRELNKRMNKVLSQEIQSRENSTDKKNTTPKPSLLPWLLLGFSWAMFVTYILLKYWVLNSSL